LGVTEEVCFSTGVSEKEVLSFLRRFGHNTNSFLLAYGGCDWFRSYTPSGLIAYARSGRTCVLAGDPLCCREDILPVLQLFSQQVGSQYRIALVLVSSWLVPQLKQAGYAVIEVGTDAFFDLQTWRPRGDRAKKVRSAVNLARRSGITVTPYQVVNGRAPYLEEQMQACAEAWLASQRGFTIRFFSAVRPLEWAEEKRSFLAWHEGRLIGFVTCSPIYARNGWYIEDIIRHPDVLYGTTELLITTALESLREEGFSVATLGLSPFANSCRDIGHPGRMRVLSAILTALTPFYNFRGLHHYKKKFAPSWWEPVYVAFLPDRLTWGLVLDVIDALVPGGFLRLIRDWPLNYSRSLLGHRIAALSRAHPSTLPSKRASFK
jgi:phosphatidylglycerol lysyltransferase